MLLVCKNAAVGYGSEVMAKDINFLVHEKDYMCIIGENGAGKSTLLKTVLGLQKPISGSVSLGYGIKRSDIGYLPQQTTMQRNFPAKVMEIVLSGLQGNKGIMPFYTAKDKERAEKNLELLGVKDLQKKSYRELSGGQQQRVLLARALCAAENLLILDEPVSGLDPDAAAEMYNLIRKLNRDGLSIVMVSHDMEAVHKYATHVLRLGKKPFYSSIEKYEEFEKKNNKGKR